MGSLIFPFGGRPRDEGYKIENSVALGGLGAFSKTFGNYAGRTWSVSGWIKRSRLGVLGDGLISCHSGTTGASTEVFGLTHITNSDRIQQYDRWGGTIYAQSNPPNLYRDPSVWMHVLVTHDPYGTGKCRIYVDGIMIDESPSTTLAPTGGPYHHLVCGLRSRAIVYSDAYWAEMVYLEDRILTPENVGEWHPLNDEVWRPIDISELDYTGGVNSFHLDFADSENLGKDVSGRGNHFSYYGTITPNMQSTDTPTNND